MASEICFYRLSRRFVGTRRAPSRSESIISYTQAIGHHIGVLDCLTPEFKFSAADYQNLLAGMPEGRARRKLEGVLRWGEIEIAKEHASELLDALRKTAEGLPSREREWAARLMRLLSLVKQEPAIYLVARRVESDSCSLWGTN
ncbi:MAG: formate hydrogenlyase maturation HycH family protein [Desulfofundulus sp.]